MIVMTPHPPADPVICGPTCSGKTVITPSWTFEVGGCSPFGGGGTWERKEAPYPIWVRNQSPTGADCILRRCPVALTAASGPSMSTSWLFPLSGKAVLLIEQGVLLPWAGAAGARGPPGQLLTCLCQPTTGRPWKGAARGPES